MSRAFFILVVLLLASTIMQAQTIIYLPNEVGGGPAIIQDESDPAPPGYTAASDQECAQQVIDADPFCLETNWDGICQDAYIECFLANCPDVIVLLPIELDDGPALLICGGDPVPTGYVAASDQDCAQQVVDENPECLDFVWDGPCQVAYNTCQ
ncbi:MAG: hypothetical protein HKN79_08435, partial [Flavobacteriales bacterium]|nr:hypothetical protein [Flavobacteriales bacterium]